MPVRLAAAEEAAETAELEAAEAAVAFEAEAEAASRSRSDRGMAACSGEASTLSAGSKAGSASGVGWEGEGGLAPPRTVGDIALALEGLQKEALAPQTTEAKRCAPPCHRSACPSAAPSQRGRNLATAAPTLRWRVAVRPRSSRYALRRRVKMLKAEQKRLASEEAELEQVRREAEAVQQLLRRRRQAFSTEGGGTRASATTAVGRSLGGRAESSQGGWATDPPVSHRDARAAALTVAQFVRTGRWAPPAAKAHAAAGRRVSAPMPTEGAASVSSTAAACTAPASAPLARRPLNDPSAPSGLLSPLSALGGIESPRRSLLPSPAVIGPSTVSHHADSTTPSRIPVRSKRVHFRSPKCHTPLQLDTVPLGVRNV